MATKQSQILRDRVARLHVGLYIAFGIGVLVCGLVSWQWSDPLRFVSFVAAAALGSVLKVRLPGLTGTTSVSSLFVLISLVNLSLPEALVMYRHALKPAMIGVVTIIGVVFGYLMGGAVVVENVFSWNGLGRLAIQAINYRDYPLIQGFILLFATIIVIMSVLLDIAYAWLDPRISVA